MISKEYRLEIRSSTVFRKGNNYFPSFIQICVHCNTSKCLIFISHIAENAGILSLFLAGVPYVFCQKSKYIKVIQLYFVQSFMGNIIYNMHAKELERKKKIQSLFCTDNRV
jgi:hypothetical protein